MTLSSNPYFRPLLAPTVFLLVSLPLLVWLGVWQVHRLEWKLGLIQRMEERVNAPAIDIAGLQPGIDDEYRRYRVSGSFVPGHTFYWLTTSNEYGVGYQVFAPFRLADGRLAIVNRGYVPASMKDAPSRAATSSPEQFDAIARIPRIPGMLDAENDIKANIWFTRDTPAMCALVDAGDCLPLYLEREGEVAEGEWPKPDAAQVTLVNNHLDYALTWFGLAIVLIVIYLAFHKAQGRIGYARNSGDEL